MASFDELKVLKIAEQIADATWINVVSLPPFAKSVIGSQLARAADSIGANIAESYGRYHFSDKLNFLYYARGSLFETKYWLNRALKRDLLKSELVEARANQLIELSSPTQLHGSQPARVAT